MSDTQLTPDWCPTCARLTPIRHPTGALMTRPATNWLDWHLTDTCLTRSIDLPNNHPNTFRVCSPSYKYKEAVSLCIYYKCYVMLYLWYSLRVRNIKSNICSMDQWQIKQYIFIYIIKGVKYWQKKSMQVGVHSLHVHISIIMLATIYDHVRKKNVKPYFMVPVA